MGDLVTIRCINGKLKGEKWKFDRVDTALIGRKAAEDNTIVNKINIPDNDRISRFNCFLKIDPPYVIARDMGSLNGTYINGRLIGKREDGISAADGRRGSYREVKLKNGDVIGMGTKHHKEEFIVEIKPDVLDGKMQISEMISEAIKEQEEEARKCADAMVGLRVLGKLGDGGFGSVQLVEEVKTHKKMALKLMHPAVRTNPQKRSWFMREGKIMAQLKHPNIVRTYDLLSDGANFHILMEYCRGGSVDYLCSRMGGKLELGAATNIILQVLDGLDYAHNATVTMETKSGLQRVKGIVHRDIKPQNMLLAEDGTVKLSDFGLAKAFELAGQTAGGFSTLSGEFCGSFMFCSRKQLKNYRDAKPDVDVWAAAASYYYLLTGRGVRNHKRGQDIHSYVFNNDVQPILSRNPNLPVKLARVIDRVLREEDNYTGTCTTAREFRNQILEVLR